jgi:chaperonin cofactor prefoldin
MERQLRLHAIQNKIGEFYLRSKREDLFTWIIDLERIQTCLNYYRDYERDSNKRLEDVALENARLKYELSEVKKSNAEMNKIIEGWEQLL